MKTSNKILSIAAGLLVIMLFTGMVITKNNMILSKDSFIDGSGNPQSVQLLDTFNSEIINIDKNYYATLDASLEGISVMADDNIVESIKVVDDGGLNFISSHEKEIRPKGPVVVTIGTKGKGVLHINMEDKAKLNCVGATTADLIISVEDKSSLELNTNNTQTIIKSKDEARITLLGSTQELIIDGEDRVGINAMDIDVKSLRINLEDRSHFKGHQISDVVGKLKDRAKIVMSKNWTSGEVIKEDSSKIIIE